MLSGFSLKRHLILFAVLELFAADSKKKKSSWHSKCRPAQPVWRTDLTSYFPCRVRSTASHKHGFTVQHHSRTAAASCCHFCLSLSHIHTCAVCWSVWEQVELPGRGSCLGQFPRGDEKRSSSSSANVAWTPTSTGLRLRRELRAGVRARPGEGEGGLSSPRPTVRHGGPWHRFLLCSMKSRMSPKGKVAWHWPQVSRSCSREG